MGGRGSADPLPAKRGGRPRTTDMRAVMNAILYLAGGGIQWRMLPKDFPPVSTVRGYFYSWRSAGLWEAINHVLVMAARELEGREASPTARRVIDSQSVKTTESGGNCRLRRGQEDQGTQASHHHRHARADAVRSGPCRRCPGSRRRVPMSSRPFVTAFHGCVMSSPTAATRGKNFVPPSRGIGEWTIEIIKRSDTAKGFEVLPRRWVVERTFAWLGRCRRLAKDWEWFHRKLHRLDHHRKHQNHDPTPRNVLLRLINF